MALATPNDMHAFCMDWYRRQVEHQGFHNYPTWLVDNFISNTQRLTDSWGCVAADALEDAYRNDTPDEAKHTAINDVEVELEECWRADLEIAQTGELAGVAASLLEWAAGQIQWREIAERIVEREIERQINALDEGDNEP